MSRLKRALKKIPVLGTSARVLRDFFRAPSDAVESLRDRVVWSRSRAPTPSGEARHVVLVSTEPKVRDTKLAQAIRLAGLRVSLVTPESRGQNACGDFDTVRVVTNPWNALRALDDLRPDVVHVVAQLWDRYRWVGHLVRGLRSRRSEIALVYDQYDCLRGMVREGQPVPEEALAVEKLAFESADHLCCRHLEPIVLRRRFGFSTSRATYFPDYPRQTPRDRGPRAIAEGDELHVVYCGGVWPEDRFSAEEKGYAQYIEVARALAKQRIHLHIFPAPRPNLAADFDDFYSLYLAEAARNRFLHISPPVSHAELMELLPSFDAALHVYGTKIDREVGMNTPEKLRYSSANKLFDYIEAGLPVLVHRGLHHAGVVRHFGAAVVCSDISEVRRGLVEALRSPPGPEVGLTCSIDAQAPRLARMYREVTARAREKLTERRVRGRYTVT